MKSYLAVRAVLSITGRFNWPVSRFARSCMVCAVAVTRARPGIIIMNIPGRDEISEGMTGNPSGPILGGPIGGGGGGVRPSGVGAVTDDSFSLPAFVTTIEYIGSSFFSRCTDILKRSMSRLWSMTWKRSLVVSGFIVAVISKRSVSSQLGPLIW